MNVHHNFGIAVRMLREELQLLQEPGSYVGEVVKVMGKSKVLVKVHLVSLLYFFQAMLVHICFALGTMDGQYFVANPQSVEHYFCLARKTRICLASRKGH